MVLFEGHAARLEFDDFAARAAPGVYSVAFEAGRLHAERRQDSVLRTATTERWAVSPIASSRGARVKPKPPCVYDTARASDVVTLLTDPAGAELYETCVAAVVAWDGASLVLPPDDRPRVASLAEAFIAPHVPHRRAPIHRDATSPVLLINAVAHRTVAGASLAPFHRLLEAIEATATKPRVGGLT